MIPINETLRARLRAMPVQRIPQPVSPFEEFISQFPGHKTLGTPGTVAAYGAGLFLIWKLLK
jgi:hypothetical protein